MSATRSWAELAAAYVIVWLIVTPLSVAVGGAVVLAIVYAALAWPTAALLAFVALLLALAYGK